MNGSAERAMRSVKDLFDKDTVSTGYELIEVVFLINRNVNKDGSGSPSEKFFRTRPRSSLPNSLRREIDHRELQAKRHRNIERMSLKKGCPNKSLFSVGDRVLIQDVASSKKWDSEGIIKAVRTAEDNTTQSYIVKSDSGNALLRNKRWLKLKPQLEERRGTFSVDS